jgi:hypothetical protein
MIRQKCVICESNLEEIYTNKNYPITNSSPELDHTFEDDICADQIICKCIDCECIQLKNLIDPEILYNASHNLTYNTETWKEHHNLFFSFVTEDNIESIFEVGGSSGVLYEKLKDKKIEYKCLDLCEETTIPTSQYIIGNCENFNYESVDNIVMSHVFEHLYNPLDFIKCLVKYSVKNIYLSIPNLEYLLINKRPYVITNEHTYYIDKNYMTHLFSKYGYSVSKFQEFKNHSLFLKFTLTNSNVIPLTKNISLSNTYLDIINYKKSINIDIPANSYIIPGGYLGQFLYTLAKPDNFYGFIDNDITKQGKRIYGTPFYTYSFDVLKKHINEKLNIIIVSSPYTKELIEQIKLYSSNFSIVVV